MAELSNDELNKIKSTTPFSIGRRIKKIREEKGITQIELGDRIGSDRQYLYKIESGKVSVSVSKLVIIITALEISLEEFFSEGFNL